MAAAKKLRAVSADESPPPSQKTVTEAAANGTTRELMVAMRARIASAVEDPNTPARDLAALTKRLGEVVNIIESIDAREQDEVDTGGSSGDEAWSAI